MGAPPNSAVPTGTRSSSQLVERGSLKLSVIEIEGSLCITLVMDGSTVIETFCFFLTRDRGNLRMYSPDQGARKCHEIEIRHSRIPSSRQCVSLSRNMAAGGPIWPAL